MFNHATCMTNTILTIGKSDPYAVFTLNGQKVFKSQTKKKTLNPDWGEAFNISVVCFS